MQLWILLKQLEEINIQFARFLDTLTIPTTSTPLSNSFEESSRQPDTPTAPTQTKVMTSALPKTPPLTKITTINSRVEQGRAMAWTQPEPLPTSPNHPTLTTQSEPPHSTAVPAMLATKLDHDTHSQHDLMSLLTHIDEQCAELEMIFAQLENHPGMTTMVPQDVPPASSTPCKLRYIITSDPTPTDHQHRFLIPPVTLDHDPLGKTCHGVLPDAMRHSGVSRLNSSSKRSLTRFVSASCSAVKRSWAACACLTSSIWRRNLRGALLGSFW